MISLSGIILNETIVQLAGRSIMLDDLREHLVSTGIEQQTGILRFNFVDH